MTLHDSQRKMHRITTTIKKKKKKREKKERKEKKEREKRSCDPLAVVPGPD